MKVVFNGNALLGPLTGIGQYAYHLATGLQQQRDLELQLFYAGHLDSKVRDGAPIAVGKFKELVRNLMPGAYGLHRALQQRLFNRSVRGQGFDLYHEPNFLSYRFDGPTVVTVHDLSWIRYPQTHPAQRVAAMDKYFEPGLRNATLVLTDSEFVKREVMEVFGIAPERIRPVALGLDAQFKPMDQEQTRAVLAPLGLEHGGYFLSVGTMEPRKNIETTVMAYSRLPQPLRRRYPLVMAGMKGWRTGALEKVLEPLVASGEVRILGYLARTDLATVMAGALAMVYPSLYEGFGLPPLEAMGCAVPAITSNSTSLPEVVGDTGIMVESLDVDALTAAMQSMAETPDLRAQLSVKALARAQQFTWQQCAEETAAAYRLAANKPL